PIHFGPRMTGWKRMAFRISDQFPARDRARDLAYEARVDGRWIHMALDGKTGTLIHEFDGRIPAGEHDFVLRVTDDRGNTLEFRRTFTLYPPLHPLMRTTWTSRLRPGHKAPTFDVLLDDDTRLKSGSLAGTPYILFFYNHDGSETCTKEACNIRDGIARLRAAGYQVYGVSEDSTKKHSSFRAKYELPYPLISDPDNALA